MRYEKGHKETTRKRIIENASRRFRKDGVDAVGLASLMADAGLTHGGFYNHFRSKEDLVAASLANALSETFDGISKVVAARGGGLERYVRAYLDERHRDAPDKGCAIAATAAELARRPEATRQAISEKIESFLSMIEQYLPPALQKEEKAARALAIFSLMVGALQLSRIFTDPEQSKRALEGGIAAALYLADRPCTGV